MVACEGTLRLQRTVLEYSDEFGHWSGSYDDPVAYPQGARSIRLHSRWFLIPFHHQRWPKIGPITVSSIMLPLVYQVKNSVVPYTPLDANSIV